MSIELEAPTKSRGRPAGKARVWREAGLRLHDLSFVRAVAQGVSTSAAARRYLPELIADERVASTYLRRVLQNASDILEGVGDEFGRKALASFAQSRTQAKQESSRVEQAGARVEIAPTLDEFAEEIGAEDFSEQELQEMYLDRYGSRSEDSTKPAIEVEPPVAIDAVLRALSIVQSRGVVLPKASDPVRLWFSPGLVDRLIAVNVVLLQDLVALVNNQGRHWYKHVPGVGMDRAQRLVAWLVEHEPYLELQVVPRSRWEDGSAGEVDASGQQPMVSMPIALQPGQLLAMSNGADDQSNSLRAAGPNALNAQSDVDAIKAWIETLSFKSPNTQVAYARDAQRLLMWTHERGKSLSTLTVGDAAAHARFLRNPPDHWVGKLPARRDWPDWRPMRGPLSPRSASRALAAIGHLYGFLVETGYLVANPFARIRHTQPSPTADVDTMRSLSVSQMHLVEEFIAQMDESPAKRRLVAILSLLQSTGLRIGELNLTWAAVQPMRVQQDAQETEAVSMQCLRVLGKGSRERLMPLRPEVLSALQAHRQDRIELEKTGVLDAIEQGDAPLFSVLEKPVHGRMASANGALSSAGIHRVIKRMFAGVAARCDDPETRAEFERATCHWLRHTFAHRILGVSGQDLPVTQQLLGHKSIATTGVYVKADMSQRVNAVMALPSMFSENGRLT